MTVTKARKILGALAKTLSDEQILKELSVTEFIAELVIQMYQNEKGNYNGQRNA